MAEYGRRTRADYQCPPSTTARKEKVSGGNVVKLTEQQKRELEALRNMPDDEIDLSDIPEITDWSGFKMGRFYIPKWKDFSLKLDEYVIDLLDRRLADGQTLDEAVNKALGAQMYRIRFPIRVERAEEAIRRIQESPEEAENLNDQQKDDIEAPMRYAYRGNPLFRRLAQPGEAA